MNNKTIWDVIIIGGSYSGLAAGMALGRALRNVLIVDSGKPCNRQTPHSHNFLTQDGSMLANTRRCTPATRLANQEATMHEPNEAMQKTLAIVYTSCMLRSSNLSP